MHSIFNKNLIDICDLCIICNNLLISIKALKTSTDHKQKTKKKWEPKIRLQKVISCLHLYSTEIDKIT